MKYIIALFTLALVLGCTTPDEVEKTQNEPYEDTTFKELLSDYEFAKETEWFSDDQAVYAESVIQITEDVNMNQTLVFDDNQNLQEIVWEKDGETMTIDVRSQIEEVLGLIHEQEPVVSSNMDQLLDNAENLLDEHVDNFMDEVKDNIRDLF